MLEDQINASDNQFPILGDFPISAPCSARSLMKNDTELVMMVTPVLVHGIDPADVPPVPGEHSRDPSIASFYW